MKNKVTNIILVVLCILAIYINVFMDKYKALGAFCILCMGIVALSKKK